MSIGRMNTWIDIHKRDVEIDAEGFSTPSKTWVATVPAYREGRHGSTKWANRASFTDATDLFCFRAVPYADITTGMVILCDAREFEITSVEDVKGRGMYIECLAREVKPSGQSGY